MKCINCDSKKNIKAKYVTYDYSLSCGLSGVTIENVKQYTCKQCNEQFYDLGDSHDIDRQIAELLYSVDILTGLQLRWIREHLFCLSYFELAKILDENATKLRHYEVTSIPMTKTLTRKIKLLLEDDASNRKLLVTEEKDELKLSIF